MNKVVCIGDSLTEGYDIRPGTCWVDLLRADTGIDIVNSGISGDSTAGMLSRFYPMVLAHKPTHVVIMGGTNDVALKLSQETIIANIITMARQARYHGVQAIIGIPTPFYLHADSFESEIFLEPQLMFRAIKTLQDNLHQLALEKGIPVIDFSFGMTAEYFLPDGLHPSEIGHRLMKENAVRVLERVL